MFITAVGDYFFLDIYVAATSGRVRFFLFDARALQVLHFFSHSHRQTKVYIYIDVLVLSTYIQLQLAIYASYLKLYDALPRVASLDR